MTDQDEVNWAKRAAVGFTPAIIESPFKASTFNSEEDHRQYAIRAMRHALSIGFAPYASHLLYTLCLDDSIRDQRMAGIAAGHEWMVLVKHVLVYTDYGISEGMHQGIAKANQLGHIVMSYSIGKNP